MTAPQPRQKAEIRRGGLPQAVSPGSAGALRRRCRIQSSTTQYPRGLQEPAEGQTIEPCSDRVYGLIVADRELVDNVVRNRTPPTSNWRIGGGVVTFAVEVAHQ